MAQPQHPPSTATSSTSKTHDQNPVKAVGRKIKSAFTSHQRSSVRIKRGPIPTTQQRLPKSDNTPENPFHDASASRFSGIRSLFTQRDNEHHDEDDRETDLLDVMDPEVATLSTLTNVQNSLFVPSVGNLFNRRPTYRIMENAGEERTIDKIRAKLRNRSPDEGDEDDGDGRKSALSRQQPLPRTSRPPSNFQYAVLPDGETLEGWTSADEAELDDMVRHRLHSRRAKFKRAMKGFAQYVRRPFGLFITVYATLITLFGAAWVFFLIGWISLGSKQSYTINVVDNVLVALFAIIGDGLAPFRAVDTYHMIYIAHYHRKTWKKRENLGLPKLADHNDLPEQRKGDIEPMEMDLESLISRRVPNRLARRIAPRIPRKLAKRWSTRAGTEDPEYDFSVLTDEQQAKLEHHERRFSKSHTFYKPHETETHYAFPLKLLVAVVVLLDCHSALQISLGACTWGISYKTRPFALTTVILCCSITCNIMGGVLISIGDKRTRKKDVIERMLHQELTAEAIEEMETKRLKEAEERGEIDKSVRKTLEVQREEAENEEIKKAWSSVPSLPKKLLGLGEDHRQPSLPQKARRSSADVAAADSSSPNASKSASSTTLPAVQESVARPLRPMPVFEDEVSKEGKGQRAMRLLRRADMDRS